MNDLEKTKEMAKSISETLKELKVTPEETQDILDTMKATIPTEEDHMLTHALEMGMITIMADKIKELEEFNRKMLIGAIVISAATITVAFTKDKITEKINSFKEKRKAKTE